jgi:hypothetical protein
MSSFLVGLYDFTGNRQYPRATFSTRSVPAGRIGCPCPRERLAARARTHRVGYPQAELPSLFKCLKYQLFFYEV